MIIPHNIIKELIEQARKEAPNESCGYLLGTDDEVSENYWMENIDHSPEHFSFAPKDQFAALRYARNLKNSCQLAQPSSFAFASLPGGFASGQRPYHPLCNPLVA